MQLFVIDAKVVCNLMHQRDVYLLAQLIKRVAGVNVFGPVQHDAIGQFTQPIVIAVC